MGKVQDWDSKTMGSICGSAHDMHMTLSNSLCTLFPLLPSFFVMFARKHEFFGAGTIAFTVLWHGCPGTPVQWSLATYSLWLPFEVPANVSNNS